MNIPGITIKQLLEAGVHLGHKTLRWNPRMKNFIYGEKNSIHIIDLTQTVVLIKNAMKEIHKCIANGGKILIVSTKKQAAETVFKIATETEQYYVNYRWLGGMLTNWQTIQNSIKRLKKLETDLSKEDIGFTKKEILKLGKEKDKLKRSLGGISDMKKVPEMIFIIDTDPEGIDYPIPGNDDARRSIDLYCEMLKKTILDAKKNIAVKQINGKDEKESDQKNNPEKKEIIKDKIKISKKKDIK